MSKYSQTPTDGFKNIIPGAGVVMTSFDPSTGTVNRANILGMTNGGINFKDGIAFKDYAEGIDNIPRNTKQFKRIDNSQRSITGSGTFKSINKALAKKLMAAADLSTNKLTPRADLAQTDFADIWLVFDYSDVNTGEQAGNMAIKLKNALHTGGFQIQSKNEDLADAAFEFMAHYDINNPDVVPYEVYIRDGGDTIPSIDLNTHYGSIAVGGTLTLTAETIPEGETVTWDSSNDEVATVSDGVVSGVAAGNVIINASITKSGVTYDDTCTVVVTSAS